MDSNFNFLVKTIDRVQDKWDLQNLGKPTPVSVIGLWRKGQEMHSFLRNWRKERDAEFTEKASRFSNGYRMQQQREYAKLIKDAIDGVKAAYREDVKNYCDDKENRLDAMLVTPPRQSQKDLLEALEMRGSGLTKAEALRVLPVFLDSYVATEAFRGLCRRAGYNLYVPGEAATDLYGIVDEYRSYMNRICDQMGADKPDLTAGSFFWMSDDPNFVEPIVEKFSQALDTPIQLRNDDANELTATEEAKIRTLFSGIEKYDPDKITDQLQIIQKVERIAKDYPDDVPMILKSQYGKYLELAFDIKKSRMDAVAVGTVANNSAPEGADGKQSEKQG